MAVIAIDPGKCGAIATFVNYTYRVYDIPNMTVITGKGKRLKKSTEYDLEAIKTLLGNIKTLCLQPVIYAVVERAEAVSYAATAAHGAYSNSMHANFEKGRGYGIIEALLFSIDIPIIASPRPTTWKRDLGLSAAAKTYKDKKEASRLMALDLYPELADRLSRKKDDGRAEALLLIEWLQLQLERRKIVLP